MISSTTEVWPFITAKTRPSLAESWSALALWLLGYPDQALHKSQEAISLARELAHPYSLVYALIWAATVRQFRRERQAAHELTEAIITLSLRAGLCPLGGMGHDPAGLGAIRAGPGTGGDYSDPRGNSCVAGHGGGTVSSAFPDHPGQDLCGSRSHTRGWPLWPRRRIVKARTDERFYEAELSRLKGEHLAHSPAAQEEAEAHMRQALEIARRQQAKSLELRAAMSLSRLWQQQGKGAEARQLLTEVYGWFTEGFDTADLQEARALLEALS